MPEKRDACGPRALSYPCAVPTSRSFSFSCAERYVGLFQGRPEAGTPEGSHGFITEWQTRFALPSMITAGMKGNLVVGWFAKKTALANTGTRLTSFNFTGAGLLDLDRCKIEEALVCNDGGSTGTLPHKLPGTPAVPINQKDICIPLVARIRHDNAPNDFASRMYAPISRPRSNWGYYQARVGDRTTYLRLRFRDAAAANSARQSLAAQCAAATGFTAMSPYYPKPAFENPRAVEKVGVNKQLDNYAATTMGLEYEMKGFQVGKLGDEETCNTFRDSGKDRVFAVFKKDDAAGTAYAFFDVTKDEGGFNRFDGHCKHVLELIYGPVVLTEAGRPQLDHQHKLRDLLLDVLNEQSKNYPGGGIPAQIIHFIFTERLRQHAELGNLYRVDKIVMPGALFFVNTNLIHRYIYPQLNRGVLLSNLRKLPPLSCRKEAARGRPFAPRPTLLLTQAPRAASPL